VDRGCHGVSVTDLYGHILDFLDQEQNAMAKKKGSFANDGGDDHYYQLHIKLYSRLF
jgi:hypothetical protein